METWPLLTSFLLKATVGNESLANSFPLSQILSQKCSRGLKGGAYRKDSDQACLASILQPDNGDIHLGGPEHPQEPIPQPGEQTCHLSRLY